MELKPCPFCGCKETEHGTRAGIINFFNTTILWCKWCEAEIGGADIDEVKNIWNTRPIEDSLRTENERLREALKSLVSILDGLKADAILSEPAHSDLNNARNLLIK